MTIRVSQVANLLLPRKPSMFLNTFRNDSCTTSSASSRFLVIFRATFSSRRPYCFTRSSNAPAVRALRVCTRAASGSAKDGRSETRSNSPGGHDALVSSTVCSSIISLHDSRIVQRAYQRGGQEKVWRLSRVESCECMTFPKSRTLLTQLLLGKGLCQHARN